MKTIFKNPKILITRNLKYPKDHFLANVSKNIIIYIYIINLKFQKYFSLVLKLQHLNRALAEEALDENEENPLEFEVFPNLVIPNKRSNSHLFLRTSKRPFFGKRKYLPN